MRQIDKQIKTHRPLSRQEKNTTPYCFFMQSATVYTSRDTSRYRDRQRDRLKMNRRQIDRQIARQIDTLEIDRQLYRYLHQKDVDGYRKPRAPIHIYCPGVYMCMYRNTRTDTSIPIHTQTHRQRTPLHSRISPELFFFASCHRNRRASDILCIFLPASEASSPAPFTITTTTPSIGLHVSRIRVVISSSSSSSSSSIRI